MATTIQYCIKHVPTKKKSYGTMTLLQHEINSWITQGATP